MIQSMTPVVAAPRASVEHTLAVIGKPPSETHKIRTCKHPNTRPRLKSYERCGVRAALQCLECGQKASNFIPARGVWEQWDSRLEAQFLDDYKAACEKWKATSRDAFSSARSIASEEWWDAYGRYLKSAVWAAKRRLVMERCGGVCEACGQRPAAHVHHRNYPDTFGLEPLYDLVGVCVPCHKIIHPHMQ